jgi:hypothetical protein
VRREREEDWGAADVLMTVALRRIQPDDYDVVCDGEIVGRIYRMRSTDEELWRWMIPGLRAPTDGRSGGVAHSLDEAKAAFRTTWKTGKAGRSSALGEHRAVLPGRRPRYWPPPVEESARLRGGPFVEVATFRYHGFSRSRHALVFLQLGMGCRKSGVHPRNEGAASGQHSGPAPSCGRVCDAPPGNHFHLKEFHAGLTRG